MGLGEISGGRSAAPAVRFYYKAERRFVYKIAPEADLELIVDYPFDWQPSDRRAAIVLFYGGAFAGGTLEQFARQAVYFAGRGLVAVRAEYRVGSSHGVTPDACVEDAKSAVRWVKTHAARLGVDAERLIAGGGSAGGHLALATAVLPGFDAAEDDLEVSTVPGALVLFNPAVGEPFLEHLRERLGDSSLVDSLRPIPHVDSDCPPMYVWFGTADRLFPGGCELVEKARAVGCRVVFQQAEGADHGSFNDSRRLFAETLDGADRFLATLGYVDGEPTVLGMA